MRSYTLVRRISHADVDLLGELKVSALLGVLQQAAVEASTAVGFDPAWYTHAGRVWVVHRTRLERRMPVGGSDSLEVETSILDFRRARSLRSYTVRRAGAVVAEAATDWVYCDVATGRPARIPDEMQRAFADGTLPPTLPRPAPLPASAPGEPVTFDLAVQPSHLDHIVHVNNAAYAGFLEDGAFALFAARGWAVQRMLAAGGALRVGRLEAEYLSDAQAGERLRVSSWLGEGSMDTTPPSGVTLVQTITREDGRAVMRAHSHWVWRARPAVLGGVPSA
jgi:acyl-CoA thioester hydrolase